MSAHAMDPSLSCRVRAGQALKVSCPQAARAWKKQTVFTGLGSSSAIDILSEVMPQNSCDNGVSFLVSVRCFCGGKQTQVFQGNAGGLRHFPRVQGSTVSKVNIFLHLWILGYCSRTSGFTGNSTKRSLIATSKIASLIVLTIRKAWLDLSRSKSSRIRVQPFWAWIALHHLISLVQQNAVCDIQYRPTMLNSIEGLKASLPFKFGERREEQGL